MAEEGMSKGSSCWESAWVTDPSIFSSKSVTYTLMRENAHQTLQLQYDFRNEMKVHSERLFSHSMIFYFFFINCIKALFFF